MAPFYYSSYSSDSPDAGSTTAGYYYEDGYTTSTDATGGTLFIPYWGCGTVTAPTIYLYQTPYVYAEPEPETEEQRQERERRQAEHQRQQEELRKEQEAAFKRAEELLKEFIGLESFGKLHEVGYIELDSRKYEGRKYRVPESHMAYIEVLDKEGRVVDTLCVHPAIDCPPADHILTRVALLQNDEESILAAANHWGARERSYYS